MRKRILNVAVMVALVLCLAVVFAGCGKTSEGLEFTSNGDGTCTWSGLGTCTDTQIVVPEKNADEMVTVVGANVLGYSSEVTKVTLPEGVTTIGEDAFYNAGLTEIVLNKGLKTIGSMAFYSCEGLTAVDFPDTLEIIGENAFDSCEGLAGVKFPAGLQSIGEWAFARCAGITEVILPEGLTELGMYAFADCTAVKVISIPSTVNEVKFAGPKGTMAESYSGHFDTTSLEELNFAGDWTAFDLAVRHEVNEDRTEEFVPYYGGRLVRDVDKTEYAPNGVLTEANTQSVICAMLNRQTIKVNGQQYTMTREKPVGKYHVENTFGFMKASFTQDGMLTVGYENLGTTDVFTGAYIYDEETNLYFFDASGSYEGENYDIEKHMVFFGDFLYCYDIVRTSSGWEESVRFWTPDIQ